MQNTPIEINFSLLKDNPLEGKSVWMTFESNKIKNLKMELLHGNPTCYLVSGYRGAGKTTFVNLVQEEITQSPETKDKVIFVKSSFANYNGHEKLLRVLVRNLFLQCKDNPALKDEKNKKVYDELLDLELRTRYNINEQFNYKTEQLVEKVTEFEARLITIDNLKAWFPLVFTSATSLFSFISNHFKNGWLIEGGLIAISLVYGIFQNSRIASKKQDNKVISAGVTGDSINDGETAEYRLLSFLTEINKLEIKIIFVLDELDKVEDKALLTSLMNEMKPIMLAGKAHFILVAGQDLSYRYHSSLFLDDEVISTLFSRVIHVPLTEAATFKSFFNQHIAKSQENLDNEELNIVLNHLIYKSKLIPRAFISRLRQMLTWEQVAATVTAELDVENLSLKGELWNNMKRDSDCLSAITATYKDYIKIYSLEESVEDYLLMQLFSVSAELLYKETHIESIIEKYENSTELQNLHYIQFLLPAIEALYVNLGLDNTDPSTNSKQVEPEEGEEENPKPHLAEGYTLSNPHIKHNGKQIAHFKNVYSRLKAVLYSGLSLMKPDKVSQGGISMYQLLKLSVDNKYISIRLPVVDTDIELLDRERDLGSDGIWSERLLLFEKMGIDYHQLVSKFCKQILLNYIGEQYSLRFTEKEGGIIGQTFNGQTVCLVEYLYYANTVTLNEKDLLAIVNKMSDSVYLNKIGNAKPKTVILIAFENGQQTVAELEFKTRTLISEIYPEGKERVSAVYCATDAFHLLHLEVKKVQFEKLLPIIIHDAKYYWGDNYIDVTQKIQALADEHYQEFKITNELMGGDPAKGEQKLLSVDCTIKGERKLLEGSEHNFFTFNQPVTN